MPTYSYYCGRCDQRFELFFNISSYESNPQCIHCKSSKTERDYETDLISICPSVKKADSELKTLGDLAMRNTERMSTDQKQELYIKHNSYKDDKLETKELPKGMSYKKKPPKPVWTDGKTKKKRRGLK